MKNFNLTKTQQHNLLALARRSIQQGMATGYPLHVNLDNYETSLVANGACFVTLTINHELRGCIGSLEARRPLLIDVCENAFASAFRDPRFPPLTAHEFDAVHIEISVLTPLQEISFSSEADLLAQIVPFEDGLVLEEDYRRGTFLPLVWAQLPDKESFLANLKRKAGLPASYWSNSLRCYRYHTVVFEEEN